MSQAMTEERKTTFEERIEQENERLRQKIYFKKS